MPELSRFYGGIIRMYVEVSARHHAPHFHPYDQDEVAIFRIEPIAMIAGAMPKRQQRLIEAWAEIHEEELRSDWQLLQAGWKPLPIQPLA